ncbi:MAG: hypothetical protein AB4041_19210 [Microcystaceae cyanobacterium]
MKLKLASFGFIGLVLLNTGSVIAQSREYSFSGNVQQVWEDGFRLKTSERSITVDSWELCGDNTARYLKTGDQVTVAGRFERREFDASSITKADGASVCQRESS